MTEEEMMVEDEADGIPGGRLAFANLIHSLKWKLRTKPERKVRMQKQRCSKPRTTV